MKTNKIFAATTALTLVVFASSAFALPTLTVDLANTNASGYPQLTMDFEDNNGSDYIVTAVSISSGANVIVPARGFQFATMPFTPQTILADDGSRFPDWNLFMNVSDNYTESINPAVAGIPFSGVIAIPNDSTGPNTGHVALDLSQFTFAQLTADAAGPRDIFSWGFVGEPNPPGNQIVIIDIPEPASLMLLGLAAIGTAAFVGRRRRR